jgi:hypothetical protein
MARIAGVNIPVQKHTWVGLTHIYGIGKTRALKICAAAGVAPETKIRDLTESEIESIRGEIGRIPVEGDEHQALDGPGLLSRSAPSPRLAGSWPTDENQRAYPQGPAASH